MTVPVTKADIGKWAVVGHCWYTGFVAFQITGLTDEWVMNGATKYLPIDVYGLCPDYESAAVLRDKGTKAVKAYQSNSAKVHEKLKNELKRIFPEPKTGE